MGYPVEKLQGLTNSQTKVTGFDYLKLNIDRAKRIIKTRGIRSLYHGFVSNKLSCSRAVTFTMMPMLYTKNKELVSGMDLLNF
jgi:hypothetical protein